MTTKEIRILIVEDQEIPRKVAILSFQSLGPYIMDTAKDGKEALHLFKKNDYDLILMDIGLPDMNGLTVIENIRNSNKNLNIPIAVVSAYSDDIYRQRAKDLGVQEFIVKPITIEASTYLVEKFFLKKTEDIQTKISY